MSEPLMIDKPLAVEAKGSDEVHLLDLLVVLAQHKLLVIGMPVLFGGLATVASLMMPPMFASEAKLMPPQQQTSGVTAMLGELGGLASAAGGLGGIKSPGDLYVGLLESRTVAYNLIARFKLKERYKGTTDVVREALARNTQISIGRKDGLISITVTDKDPQFAADLANAYVDELIKLTHTMALTEASQRRLFFEKQLLEAKDQLANAEVALRKTQEKTGLIQPEGQVQALITNAAQLRGTIVAKEVQLNSIRTFAAGQNPELLRAEEELRSLRAQLGKLEKVQSSKDGSFMVPTGNLPEVGVEYVRSMRNVKYYETIFELLSKQFELAKIDEAKNSSSVQVLDKALPADNKFKPKRSVIVLAGVAFGTVFGILLAFCHAGLRRSRDNVAARQRWQRLSSALRRY
jgi:tyrosine-protein kinase Etk/Wzc